MTSPDARPNASDLHAVDEREPPRSRAPSPPPPAGRADGQDDLERIRQEVLRHEQAQLRDDAAKERDRTALFRDRSAQQTEAALLAAHPANTALRTLVAANAAFRHGALSDRRAAAADREHSAEHRVIAEAEHRRARVDLRSAQLDEVTGVFAGHLSHTVIGREIDRCRRGGSALALACFVVAGPPKGATAAGDDATVRSVGGVLRGGLRSYDPVIHARDRVFICAIASAGYVVAGERVGSLCRAVDERHPAATVTASLVVLEESDDVRSLVGRALGETGGAS